MLDDQRERANPEAKRKEIRCMLRLMRDNFERGLYEGEEYQYWQKVSALKEGWPCWSVSRSQRLNELPSPC
jgi:hypothetical protein